MNLCDSIWGGAGKKKQLYSLTERLRYSQVANRMSSLYDRLLSFFLASKQLFNQNEVAATRYKFSSQNDWDIWFCAFENADWRMKSCELHWKQGFFVKSIL